MFHLLLIHLLWLQSEAAPTGCHLLGEAVHCTNISMAEVAASYLIAQAPPTCTPPIRGEPLVECTPPLTNHAPSARSLVVQDCPPSSEDEVGVFFDLPSHFKSATFRRCPPPHLRAPSLTDLDLSECGLDEVPRLSHLIGLKRLLLRGNRISRLPDVSWWPPSLAELDLTDNRIGGNTLQAAEEEELHLTALSSSAVEVRWQKRGDDGALVYRREADPPLKMTLVSGTFIRSLHPSTAYIVCVARRTAPPAYTVDPSTCRRVVTRPDPPRLLDLSVASTSVRLRWKATGALEWRVRVRPSRSDSASTDHRFLSDGGRLHEFAVTGLEPRTDYDVCVEEAEEGGGSCVTVHTEGEEPGMNPAVGLALGLCAVGVVGVAAIALCRRGRGHPPIAEDAREGLKSGQHPITEGEDLEKEEDSCRREGGVYARSWSTLRLPQLDPPPSLFRSPCGYRDHLTSVTIFSSGHSEC